MFRINLPENVKYIIDKIYANGYEAYAVGGCVRDSILGRVPDDWDITTSALPAQIKNIFKKTIDTGIQHGTVTVMLNKVGYEVTTYRIDGEYEDMRHPKNVEFTNNLVLDLKRRDFTINAMAYNDVVGLVDEFGGIDDINNKVIKCVGHATERFSEDALRILRAVRFSAQLGFSIEEGTAKAITELSNTLVNISSERIHTELNKMLKSKNPDYFNVADELGIMQYIIPEYCSYDDNQKHAAAMLAKEVSDNLPERYAAMLVFVGSDVSKKILRDLKLDNDTINMTHHILKSFDFDVMDDEISVRRLIHNVGKQDILRVIEFRLSFEKVAGSENKVSKINKIYEMAAKLLERGDCVDLKSLALTGNDLLMLGVKPGKEIGLFLKILLDKVLIDQSLNNSDSLKKEVIELQKKQLSDEY